MGLFGAGIDQEIFQKALPWDLGREFHASLGERSQYFQKVISHFGHSMHDFLRYAVGEQIADPSFQSNEVSEHARVQAERLALVVQPHLLALKKTKRKQDKRNLKSWLHYLQEAFKQASIVRQTLEASSPGRCQYSWPVAGQKIDEFQHRPNSQHGGAKVLFHTVVPGVVRTGPEGEPVTICKAVIVPAPPLKSK
ncbi:hypothetical protein CLAFUW4_03795 [Fulvia fulva]|uniref:Uncharacterized protein n=1 Tax=Passalora fulva TaxID=5499 RepID=A0A9Q8L9J0_PASFU|nr:uncharacterized protein CLAFUR5_03767 [Fulvia fulva]KAK4632795.1 hypothetical protein CLAFUR0_03782 [Fulvia fulva]UJO13431.1 hypothetical protein CLAFUR5_03767 [Fulvia fulva]WPV11397.1 hypothetical protein CLAFUW4_03795 [Fulvia fulva]